MITKNFRKILMLMFSSISTGLDYPKITTSNLPKLTGLDGLEKQIYNQSGLENRLSGWYNMMNHMAKTNSHNNLYMRVGTGTTAPTENDYELTMPNTDVSCDTVIVDNSANYTKTYTAIFSNPTNSDITVTEVGLYGNVIYSVDYGYTMDVLLDRTVLTTPITIPAGESKTITYELSF